MRRDDQSTIQALNHNPQLRGRIFDCKDSRDQIN